MSDWPTREHWLDDDAIDTLDDDACEAPPALYPLIKCAVDEIRTRRPEAEATGRRVAELEGVLRTALEWWELKVGASGGSDEVDDYAECRAVLERKGTS